MPDREEAADLFEALLVSSDFPPLSQEAADGISAAELQDYMSVGGTIEILRVEGAATRFISLPNAAYGIVPLGSYPEMLRQAKDPAEVACWRIDVAPTWAQQKYYTVRVE